MMEIINTLNTAATIIDTVYRVSTFDWNKKALIKLAITSVAFITITTIIDVANNKKEVNEK